MTGMKITIGQLANALRVPLFGACFGHQAIALALGGSVEANPGGWVFGTTATEVTARSSDVS